MSHVEMTRFNARLTKEQKELLEYASRLGGFKTLTEFIMQTAQKRAEKIIQDHEVILADQRDKEVFFETITNPPLPNAELKDAFADFRKALGQ